MAVCKRCGGSVDWLKVDGKLTCHDAGTDVDHWDTCKKLEWEQVEKTGSWFESEKEGGYVTKFGIRLAWQSFGVVTGDLYRPSGA